MRLSSLFVCLSPSLSFLKQPLFLGKLGQVMSPMHRLSSNGKEQKSPLLLHNDGTYTWLLVPLGKDDLLSTLS